MKNLGLGVDLDDVDLAPALRRAMAALSPPMPAPTINTFLISLIKRFFYDYFSIAEHRGTRRQPVWRVVREHL
ncbi:hypothetical protein KW837_06190 [Pseudomonas sp. PDM24]|uniref:hypothetical protein n=1 Tax=Pseudomonas sp. PDM24 TaxID=2854777 RepID=UPI001C482BDB|nr:hypothetical protein [Pseudomonas sp. PDM24]MBV7493856.1 hypothetical protein [Pseudomonas sp. PDM24]